MIRKASFMAAIAALMFMSACGGSKLKEVNEETEIPEIENESKIQPQTIEVTVFSSMPVKGDRAEYFSIEPPEGQTAIKVTGTPQENSTTRGIVRANVDVKVLKSFKDKLHKLGGYNGMTLHFLDEDKEDIAKLNMGKTDLELIETELAKSTPGKVNVVFKNDIYEREYEKIFKTAKYVRLEDADFQSEKEYEKENVSSRVSVSEETSSQSESRSSSHDSDYDSDKERIKEKTREVKEKAKEKGRELKEKALDKLNDWLD